MSVSTAFYVKNDTGAQICQQHQKVRFDVLDHFPQAFFLLSQDLELINANKLGHKAIDSHLLRLRDKKLHFNSSESDALVKAVAQRLSLCEKEHFQNNVCSERIILRNGDGRCRSFTLSRESFETTNFILSIQNDLVINDGRTRALAHAFSLSQAELRILKMMVKGLRPKEIAFEVGVSLNTVRSHLRTLYAKMQVSGYDEALTYAIKLLL